MLNIFKGFFKKISGFRAYYYGVGVKSIIFSLLLFLAPGHWLFFTLFIAVSCYFYFMPSLNGSQFIFSFLTLVVISLLTVNSLGSWQIIAVLFFGFLFFLLMGIKNLIFVKRRFPYYLFNSLLLFMIFISFFRFEISPLFFIKYLLAFFGIVFLSKEFLSFSVEGFSNSPKKNLIVYGTAFLVLQVIWTISLLPISFLNAGSLVLLVVLILQDFIIHYFSGAMTRPVILKNITVFLALSLVILGASRWTP